MTGHRACKGGAGETLRFAFVPAPDPDWREESACYGMDQRLFFGTPGEDKGNEAGRIAEAKAVCAGCPVVEQCRDYAMTIREKYGVWGGLTGGERARMWRRSA